MQRIREYTHAHKRIYLRVTRKVDDPARVYVSPVVTRVVVCVCVCVRDRYAIARAPTESMKIKRNCSSPSEVKDALECRDETRRDETRHDALRCNAMQCDTTRRAEIAFYLDPRRLIPKLGTLRFSARNS